MRILTVCTANICRSPVAAAVLRSAAARRGRHDVEIASAGVLPGGRPVDPTMVEVAARHGIDVSGHVSTQMTPELLDADLVVGMGRGHIREAVVTHRPAWPRSFTLKELLRRAAVTPSRQDPETFADWLDRVGEGRSTADLMGAGDDDDIDDPHGGPVRGYEMAVSEIRSLSSDLATVLWGP